MMLWVEVEPSVGMIEDAIKEMQRLAIQIQCGVFAKINDVEVALVPVPPETPEKILWALRDTAYTQYQQDIDDLKAVEEKPVDISQEV